MYNRLKGDGPLAAKVLSLLAFFDHQEIWYKLLCAGLGDNLPGWLHELVAGRIDFEDAMARLVEYCLLEQHATAQSYSVHGCERDWTLMQLNKDMGSQLCWYAVHCIATSINIDGSNLDQLRFARLARHASRCAQRQLENAQSF